MAVRAVVGKEKESKPTHPMTQKSIIQQYQESRGYSFDEVNPARPYPPPTQWVHHNQPLISQADAIEVYRTTDTMLLKLSQHGVLNRVLAEKDNHVRVFYYIAELNEVLKKC